MIVGILQILALLIYVVYAEQLVWSDRDGPWVVFWLIAPVIAWTLWVFLS